MALIFARLARNFIKAGYFPTGETTLSRILLALDADAPRLRILDPCCGEGAALAEVKRHLVKKDRKVEYAIDEQGNVQETVTLTDKFVPAIKAIDFTPGPRYGDIVTIR